MASSRKFSEPSPRASHVSAPVGGKVYMWGGHPGGSDDASTIYSFDPLSESWARDECSGIPPPGLRNGACASAGNHLYVYAGEEGEDVYTLRNHSLCQLNLNTRTWSTISSGGPTRRRGCGEMAYDSSSHRLLFGSYGAPSKRGIGESNNIHTFDLNKGEPRPCSG